MSLFSLGATLYLSLFAPGADERLSPLRTTALALLATASGLLLFVIP